MVSELVELQRDSVLTLDSSIDDPVELYVGDRLADGNNLAIVGGLSGADAADRRHMLIEAEAGSGVTAGPKRK